MSQINVIPASLQRVRGFLALRGGLKLSLIHI